MIKLLSRKPTALRLVNPSAAKNLPRFAWSTPQRQKLKFLPLRRYNLTRSEERFSRNAETDVVCRLLLEKKNVQIGAAAHQQRHRLRDRLQRFAASFSPSQLRLPP